MAISVVAAGARTRLPSSPSPSSATGKKQAAASRDVILARRAGCLGRTRDGRSSSSAGGARDHRGGLAPAVKQRQRRAARVGGGGRSRSGGPILSADTTALRVRLKGDGKCYKLTLGSGGGGPFSGRPTWQANVQTTDKSTTEIEIPLKSFVPSMRGQPVSGHVLRPAEMLEVGLMLSLYKAGGQKNRAHVRRRHLPIRGEA